MSAPSDSIKRHKHKEAESIGYVLQAVTADMSKTVPWVRSLSLERGNSVRMAHKVHTWMLSKFDEPDADGFRTGIVDELIDVVNLMLMSGSVKPSLSDRGLIENINATNSGRKAALANLANTVMANGVSFSRLCHVALMAGFSDSMAHENDLSRWVARLPRGQTATMGNLLVLTWAVDLFIDAPSSGLIGPVLAGMEAVVSSALAEAIVAVHGMTQATRIGQYEQTMQEHLPRLGALAGIYNVELSDDVKDLLSSIKTPDVLAPIRMPRMYRETYQETVAGRVRKITDDEMVERAAVIYGLEFE